MGVLRIHYIFLCGLSFCVIWKSQWVTRIVNTQHRKPIISIVGRWNGEHAWDKALKQKEIGCEVKRIKSGKINFVLHLFLIFQNAPQNLKLSLLSGMPKSKVWVLTHIGLIFDVLINATHIYFYFPNKFVINLDSKWTNAGEYFALWILISWSTLPNYCQTRKT